MEDLTVKKLDPRRSDDWLQMMKVLMKAAPPTVKMTDQILDRCRSELLDGKMEGWLFSDGAPMSIALTKIRNDFLLGKKELLIYAAAHLRKMTESDWDACFEKMRLHSVSKGCTHMTCYTIVPRIMEMAARMGGDIETRYISIPLGGKHGKT